MVWNANGLTLQVSGVDASQHTSFSAGWVNLLTNPGLDAGTCASSILIRRVKGLSNRRFD
jgi:alpha-L-fucosidase 2